MTFQIANPPDPPELTEELWEQIKNEAAEWGIGFSRTAEMERLTAEDYAVTLS